MTIKEESNERLLSILSQPRHVVRYVHQTKETPLFKIRSYLDTLASSEQVLWMCFLASSVGAFMFFMYTKVVFIFLFSLLLLLGLIFFISSKISDSKIVATEAGIELPSNFQGSLENKLKRRWAELNLIMFAKDGHSSDRPEQVVLGFNDNCTAELNLDGFTRDSLEHLILVINTYNPEVKQVPESAIDRLKIDKSDFGKCALSFTGIWKEDMASRFGSTAFVPLDTGMELRDRSVKILGQIAFSGLSAIYLAQSKEFGTVIVKEAVLPGSSSDELHEKSIALFQRESQLLSLVDHPRIARVYDYFVENDRHYLLLEYISGKNMRDIVIEDGAIAEKTVFDWAIQIADLLVYLHGLDPPLIHRDLTPSNLILEKDGGITLIDFGAANLFLGTATGTIVGKSSYIPVEQFQGRATPASDIYALGCSLSYFLTGAEPKPFMQSNPIGVGIKINEQFNQLIMDCTSVKVEDRIDNVQLLNERLSRLTDFYSGR